MSQIHTVFFWANGIMFDLLDDVVAEELCAQGVHKINLPAEKSYSDLCQKVMLGSCTGIEFCSGVINLFGLDLSSQDLETKIIKRIKLKPESLGIISSLRLEYAKYLVLDLPSEWASQVDFSRELKELFPKDRIIQLTESGLCNLVPDVFFYLARCANTPLGECLLLDTNSKRTVSAINSGMHAAVIICPDRLKREFLLRKMTCDDYCMHARPI